MRCLSCNDLLNEYEATKRYRSSGQYLDLCKDCSSYTSEVEIDARTDLKWLIDDPVSQEFELWRD
jgi:hypothetical protein